MENPSPIPEYLRQIDFVAFDTETTGLWAVTNRVVEIGAVRFRLGNPDSQFFQQLINPLRPIPPEAIQVHSITNEMVASAPPAKPVLQDFMSFCTPSAVLIAHNAPFDISFVGCELDRACLELGNHRILDTVDIFRRFFPGLPSYSLLSLVQHFGIADSQQHRALADALFVKQLFELAVPSLPQADCLDNFLASLSVHNMSEWSGEEFELPDEYSDFRVAIESGLRLSIVYESPNHGPEIRMIWPKRLHARGSVTYVTAYCEKASAERTFRLDRISRFEIISS